MSKLDKEFKNPLIEEELIKFTNETVEKFNYNLEKFNYNVLIAKLYETYNYFSNIIKENINNDILAQNYIKILIIMSPIIPHFSSECLQSLGIKGELKWPEVDKSKLKKDKVNFVVQFNGKKRGNVISQVDTDKEALINIIKNDNKLMKNITGKSIDKIFFVKNKLINILLK